MNKSKKEEREFILPTENGNNIRIITPSKNYLVNKNENYLLIILALSIVAVVTFAGGLISMGNNMVVGRICSKAFCLNFLIIFIPAKKYAVTDDFLEFMRIIINNKVVSANFCEENEDLYLNINYIASEGCSNTYGLYLNRKTCKTEKSINDAIETVKINPVKRRWVHYLPEETEKGVCNE